MPSQFESKEEFKPERSNYQLLPFRFLRFDAARYLLVNEAGEYLFLDEEKLQNFVKHRLAADSKAYLSLKSKQFLVDSSLNATIDLLATKYRTKKSFLNGFTKLHIFVVTLRCEHSCHYCQVSRVSPDKSRYDMTQETAARAVDLLFQSPSNELKVELQGGEPLLNFGLIKFIVELVETRNQEFGRDIQFVIASNLAPLTDEMLAFFKAHNVCLSTSLDGPAFLHNANRPKLGHNSYETVIANLQRAREALGHDRIAALMTTTRLSLKYPKEIVDEYLAQGFDSIFLRPISPYGFAVKTQQKIGYSMQEFLEFYKEALEYIISVNRKGTYFFEAYAQLLLTKVLTPFATGYVDLQSPAGGGISVAVYNYDGDVYASDESRMLAEMGDKQFKLGNVHINSYKEIFAGPKIKALVTASCIESLPGCADCALQPYCGSDPVFNYATQGDIFGHRPTSDFCKKNMSLIKHLISLIESGEAETHNVFWSWIRNTPLPQLKMGAADHLA